jgi:hypothetical protein
LSWASFVRGNSCLAFFSLPLTVVNISFDVQI